MEAIPELPKRKLYQISIRLEGLPRMTPNGSHGHWAVMASERKRWRARVAMEIGSRRPIKPCEKVKATFTRHSARECDDDNLVASFKSCRDGLKDACVIDDDTRKRIVAVYKWEQAPPGKGFITIDVEEIAM